MENLSENRIKLPHRGKKLQSGRDAQSQTRRSKKRKNRLKEVVKVCPVQVDVFHYDDDEDELNNLMFVKEMEEENAAGQIDDVPQEEEAVALPIIHVESPKVRINVGRLAIFWLLFSMASIWSVATTVAVAKLRSTPISDCPESPHFEQIITTPFEHSVLKNAGDALAEEMKSALAVITAFQDGIPAKNNPKSPEKISKDLMLFEFAFKELAAPQNFQIPVSWGLPLPIANLRPARALITINSIPSTRLTIPFPIPQVIDTFVDVGPYVELLESTTPFWQPVASNTTATEAISMDFQLPLTMLWSILGVASAVALLLMIESIVSKMVSFDFSLDFEDLPTPTAPTLKKTSSPARSIFHDVSFATMAESIFGGILYINFNADLEDTAEAAPEVQEPAEPAPVEEAAPEVEEPAEPAPVEEAAPEVQEPEVQEPAEPAPVEEAAPEIQEPAEPTPVEEAAPEVQEPAERATIEEAAPEVQEPAEPATIEEAAPEVQEPAEPATIEEAAPEVQEPAEPTPVEEAAPEVQEPAEPATIEEAAPEVQEPAEPAPVEEAAPEIQEPAEPAPVEAPATQVSTPIPVRVHRSIAVGQPMLQPVLEEEDEQCTPEVFAMPTVRHQSCRKAAQSARKTILKSARRILELSPLFSPDSTPSVSTVNPIPLQLPECQTPAIQQAVAPEKTLRRSVRQAASTARTRIRQSIGGGKKRSTTAKKSVQLFATPAKPPKKASSFAKPNPTTATAQKEAAPPSTLRRSARTRKTARKVNYVY